jgi:hypothetical protein
MAEHKNETYPQTSSKLNKRIGRHVQRTRSRIGQPANLVCRGALPTLVVWHALRRRRSAAVEPGTAYAFEGGQHRHAVLPQFDSVRLFPGRRRNRVGVRAWAGADLGTDHIAGDDHFYTTIQFSPRS